MLNSVTTFCFLSPFVWSAARQLLSRNPPGSFMDAGALHFDGFVGAMFLLPMGEDNIANETLLSLESAHWAPWDSKWAGAGRWGSREPKIHEDSNCISSFSSIVPVARRRCWREAHSEELDERFKPVGHYVAWRGQWCGCMDVFERQSVPLKMLLLRFNPNPIFGTWEHPLCSQAYPRS